MVLKPPFTFSGDVCISPPTTPLIHFPIGSPMAKQCNWLEQAGIPYSFALTGPWNTNCVRLDYALHAADEYHIRIVFNQPPPSSSSIWLYWVQAVKDKGK
jgi:hypothetical protein